jgi:hypothetical protein
MTIANATASAHVTDGAITGTAAATARATLRDVA